MPTATYAVNAGVGLRTPFQDGGYVVLCGKNRDHVGQTAKRDTKFLFDPVRGRIEVDVMTQQEITPDLKRRL